MRKPLGIYLPILIVEPAIVKRMEFTELEPVRDALRHGFNNSLGMCAALLIVGCLRELLAAGAKAIDSLEDNDTVLIAEGCTHHRQCEDIGTVKLPRWLCSHTGKNLNFEFTSGTEFPLELDKYKLIIHCGGCMLNEREMKYRLKCAEDAQIPMTNYGTAIAYMKGILPRSLEIFT